MFRSADVFGVEKIFLTGYTGCPPKKEIAKTALGSEHRVVWEWIESVERIVSVLKKDGYTVAALEISPDAVPVQKIQTPQDRLVLIVGNEVEGISSDVLALCDVVTSIPMIGTKKSLNVSVATGIALFAIVTNSR